MTKKIEEVLTISQGSYRKNITLTENGIRDLFVYGSTIDPKKIDKYVPFISLCNTIFKYINTSSIKKNQTNINFIYFVRREHDRLKVDEKYKKLITDCDFYFDSLKKTMNYHYKDLQDVKEFNYSMFRIVKNKEDLNSAVLIPFDPVYLSNLTDQLDYVSTVDEFVYYYILINAYIDELKLSFKENEKQDEEYNRILNQLEERKNTLSKMPQYENIFEERKKKFSYNVEKVDNPYTSSYELMRLIYANSDLPSSLMIYDSLKKDVEIYNNDEKKSTAIIFSTLYGIMESYNLKNEEECLRNIITKSGEKKAIEGILRFMNNVSIDSKIADLLNDDYLNLGGRNI